MPIENARRSQSSNRPAVLRLDELKIIKLFGQAAELLPCDQSQDVKTFQLYSDVCHMYILDLA